MAKILAVFLVALLACGCAVSRGYSIVTATGTTIGLSIGQAPQGAGVETVLGYKRAEFAYVPTNRKADGEAASEESGAKDSANVLMELHYSGTSSSGIYQRLAVGDIAVARPGAAAMFIRNAEGEIDSNAAQALENIGQIDNAWPDENNQ